MTPIQLPSRADMKTIIAAALENSALQCQQPWFDPGETLCSYSGPCVVGVCIPVELRHTISGTIDVLLHDGAVQVMEDGDHDWLIYLQDAHDGGDVDRIRELIA